MISLKEIVQKHKRKAPKNRTAMDDYLLSLAEKCKNKRIPFICNFDLTARCNLHCVHCFGTNCDSKKQRRRELSTKEVFKILDKIAQVECLVLVLTGGEIFTRPDILDIYSYARAKGFLISLYTNGTLITQGIIDLFKKQPPYNIEISLYGATKGTYEKITRVPGSFERCLKGIDMILSNNIPLLLKTPAININQNEIFEIKEFASDLRVQFLYNHCITCNKEGGKSPYNYRLTPEQGMELDIINSNRKRQVFLLKALSEFKPPRIRSIWRCGAGRNTFNISAYGDMLPCGMCYFYGLDLSKYSFEEIWDIKFPKFLNKKPSQVYKCGTCKIAYACNYCPAVLYYEGKNHDGPVEYLCECAKIRNDLRNDMLNLSKKGGMTING